MICSGLLVKLAYYKSITIFLGTSNSVKQKPISSTHYTCPDPWSPRRHAARMTSPGVLPLTPPKHSDLPVRDHFRCPALPSALSDSPTFHPLFSGRPSRHDTFVTIIPFMTIAAALPGRCTCLDLNLRHVRAA